jgi:hypothetical protein
MRMAGVSVAAAVLLAVFFPWSVIVVVPSVLVPVVVAGKAGVLVCPGVFRVIVRAAHERGPSTCTAVV